MVSPRSNLHLYRSIWRNTNWNYWQKVMPYQVAKNWLLNFKMLLKDGQQSGGGSILFLSDAHDFQVKMGFGQGTNNQEELLSCKNLMLFTLENGCTQIHVFGDSMLTFNCINKNQVWKNIILMPILEELCDSLTLSWFLHVLIFTRREIGQQIASQKRALRWIKDCGL